MASIFRNFQANLYASPSLVVPYLALGASLGVGLLTRSANAALLTGTASAIAWSEASKRLVIEDGRSYPVLLSIPSANPQPKPQVWLTFDDGPAADTNDILDVLEAYAAPATFFFIGSHSCRYKDLDRLALRLAKGGHKVGNHSWSHPSFLWLNRDTTKSEIAEADRRLKEVFPQTYLPIFRPPFGYRTRSMMDCLQEIGLTAVGWGLNSLDFLRPQPIDIVARVSAQVRDGSIILFHDGPQERSRTVKALPEILDELKRQGYIFTTPKLEFLS